MHFARIAPSRRAGTARRGNGVASCRTCHRRCSGDQGTRFAQGRGSDQHAPQGQQRDRQHHPGRGLCGLLQGDGRDGPGCAEAAYRSYHADQPGEFPCRRDVPDRQGRGRANPYCGQQGCHRSSLSSKSSNRFFAPAMAQRPRTAYVARPTSPPTCTNGSSPTPRRSRSKAKTVAVLHYEHELGLYQHALDGDDPTASTCSRVDNDGYIIANSASEPAVDEREQGR